MPSLFVESVMSCGSVVRECGYGVRKSGAIGVKRDYNKGLKRKGKLLGQKVSNRQKFILSQYSTVVHII